MKPIRIDGFTEKCPKCGEKVMYAVYKLKKTVIKQDVLAYCDGIFDALEIVQDLPSEDRPQGE